MKQVVRAFEESIRRIQDIQNEKIYAFNIAGNIYKLSFFQDRWFWDFLNDTKTYSYQFIGSSMKEAIDKAIRDTFTVYEFDNLKEFADWLVKETK